MALCTANWNTRLVPPVHLLALVGGVVFLAVQLLLNEAGKKMNWPATAIGLFLPMFGLAGVGLLRLTTLPTAHALPLAAAMALLGCISTLLWARAAARSGP